MKLLKIAHRQALNVVAFNKTMVFLRCTRLFLSFPFILHFFIRLLRDGRPPFGTAFTFFLSRINIIHQRIFTPGLLLLTIPFLFGELFLFVAIICFNNELTNNIPFAGCLTWADLFHH